MVDVGKWDRGRLVARSRWWRAMIVGERERSGDR